MTAPRAVGRPAEVLPLAVAAALVSLPVLLPPEIHTWSLLICAGLAIAALGMVAISPPRGAALAVPAMLLFVPPAVAAILLAPSRARALDEASAFAVLLFAGLLGARVAREGRVVAVLSAAMIVLGTMAALQAILQHHVFYPQQAALLRAERGPEAAALLVRFAAGRPSGPFILPAVLGTFLAMSLPPVVVYLLRARSSMARAGLLITIAVQGYALLLTRSFGALLAAGVAALLLLPLLSRPARRIAALAIVVGMLAGSGFFLHARRAEIGHAAGSDPVSLRLGNWEAAAGMIGDHPAFGVGPGAFGTSYTLYMRAGMNETRYAHNSYLQIIACWGLWALAPLGMLLASSVRAVWRMVPRRDPRLALAAGAAAFLVHNLIDFGAYLPGIALPAAVLIGTILGAANDRAAATSTVTGVGWPRIAGASLSALLLVAIVVPQTRSRSLLEAARQASLAGEDVRAADLARAATVARPAEPDAWAFLAEMTLAWWHDDPERRAAGEAAAVRAVQLDPQSAIRHHTLALYHLAAGAGAAAYLEQAIAHRLYPRKELYRLPDGPGGEGTP